MSSWHVPEIIDPVFAKTSQNARFLLSENERFGLVFVKTGSINSGTGLWRSTNELSSRLIGSRQDSLKLRESIMCTEIFFSSANPKIPRLIFRFSNSANSWAHFSIANPQFSWLRRSTENANPQIFVIIRNLQRKLGRRYYLSFVAAHGHTSHIILLHRLNMKLDLQSLFGLLCTAVLIGWDPRNPPPPRILGSYRGRCWSAKIDDISL